MSLQWHSMYNYRASGFGGLGALGIAKTKPHDPAYCAANTNDCASCFACCSQNHGRNYRYPQCLTRCKLRFGPDACDSPVVPPPTVNNCGIVCTSPAPQHEQCHWECPTGVQPPPPQVIKEYPATRNVILTGSEQTVPITPYYEPSDSGGGILSSVAQYWWIPVAGFVAWKVIGK